MQKYRIKSIKIIIYLCGVLCSKNATSQIIYGQENFIQYNIGTLPIIISVPHGGSIAPNDIPNRTCNNPTIVTDANTIDLAHKIDSVFISKTNCAPHTIICHLKRTKLDANRNQNNGACGHPKTIQAWTEFHKFIDTARYLVYQKYQNQAFYFDLHGHGNPIQRVELGYLLYDEELERDDASLDLPQYIENSSIQNLVKINQNKLSHSKLLRGTSSFGSLLAKRSFPTVPSHTIPKPGTDTNYFSGGYNTINHTCYNPMLDINGVQVECNFQNLRDSTKNRIKFAEAFVTSVIEFMIVHFGLDLMECNKISSVQKNDKHLPFIYPTLVKANGVLNLINVNEPCKISIYEQNGKQVFHSVHFSNQIQLSEDILSGIYLVKLESGGEITNFKIVVID